MEWRVLILATELPWTAKLVALVLSTHMDVNGASCFPSLTTIARESGLSRRAVVYALDKLEAAGCIERVRGGRGKPTRYRASSARGALPTGSQLVHTVHSTSARGAPESDQESAKSLSTRADARVPKKKGRASARPDGAHPDSNYFDDAGGA
jgi:hypothetical protein